MSIAVDLQLLVEQLEAKEQELLEREQAVAEAAEQLSQEAQVRQAFASGKQDERGRVVALIDLQLETLGRSGLNALSLRTLRQQLLEVPG
jgi:hypothetical protein